MQAANESENQKVKLLATLELDETADLVAEIVTQQTGAAATAVILWDIDLESFSDKFIFGDKKRELTKLVEAYMEAGVAPTARSSELDLDGFAVKTPKELTPIIAYRLENEGGLIAVILAAGSSEEEDSLSDKLGNFPLEDALNNAWRYRELERENERLRGQYEDMEDRVSMFEDQTRKLINDLTHSNSIRNIRLSRDRLVYSISNMVRSSLNIQRVLETAVEQIGSEFHTSRCLILRSVDSVDQLNVFEFVQSNIEPAAQLFRSEEGMNFATLALTSPTPHEVDDRDTHGYNAEFLKKLELRSGLLVPLVLRERILGVMFLQQVDHAREWSIDDVSLIGSLADNLSVAIENAELHQEREQQAVTDGLTGIANRRSFNETFAREFERARRYGEPLSLVVVDLDHLKTINDTHGHKAGDEAIRTIGKLLKQSSRTVDLPARYGGEEFCLLLPNTEIDMAEQLAERLRRLITEAEVEGPMKRISASLGVASYPLHADEPDELFKRADEALYSAKAAGRNRVCVAPTPDASSDKMFIQGKGKSFGEHMHLE